MIEAQTSWNRNTAGGRWLALRVTVRETQLRWVQVNLINWVGASSGGVEHFLISVHSSTHLTNHRFIHVIDTLHFIQLKKHHPKHYQGLASRCYHQFLFSSSSSEQHLPQEPFVSVPCQVAV